MRTVQLQEGRTRRKAEERLAYSWFERMAHETCRKVQMPKIKAQDFLMLPETLCVKTIKVWLEFRVQGFLSTY